MGGREHLVDRSIFGTVTFVVAQLLILMAEDFALPQPRILILINFLLYTCRGISVHYSFHKKNEMCY